MPKGPITGHFSWAEARCPCGCIVPRQILIEIEETARWAERIRKVLGDRSISVLSWYRCKRYNERVGGVSNSQHVLGRAIDVVVRTLHPRQVQGIIVATKCYPEIVRGLGKYPGFTHIDRRDGPPVMWGIDRVGA